MKAPTPWADSGPRRTPLTEAKFSEVIAGEGLELVRELRFLLDSDSDSWTERRLYSVYRTSTDFENYLDDHGAQANQAFFTLRELVSGVRWLALGCSCLVHLRSRLGAYPHVSAEWTQELLPKHLRRAIQRFGADLLGVSEALRQEWVRMGQEWPSSVPDLHQALLAPDLILPANRVLEEEELQDEGGSGNPAARFAGRILRLCQAWRPALQAANQASTHAGRHGFMGKYCTEATARDLEAHVHSLQSDYDSLLRGGEQEAECETLLELRGSISQCLHLLEAVTALTHLYERHKVHQRQVATRRILSGVLDWESFLEGLIEDGARPALESLLRAEAAAERLMAGLTQQNCVELPIPEGVVLHARPLSLVVGVVHHHGLPVEMEIEGDKASAASMLNMLVLCGSHLDAKSVKFHGDSAVLGDLRQLFGAGLGEGGIDGLPDQLNYLVR